jgi:hypothetical protein
LTRFEHRCHPVSRPCWVLISNPEHLVSDTNCSWADTYSPTAFMWKCIWSLP